MTSSLLSLYDRGIVALHQEISKTTGHFEWCFQKEWPTEPHTPNMPRNTISIKHLKIQGLANVGQYSMFPQTVQKKPSLFWYYYNVVCLFIYSWLLLHGHVHEKRTNVNTFLDCVRSCRMVQIFHLHVRQPMIPSTTLVHLFYKYISINTN